MKRILLGQLSSNGDCLYATTIARQIKHDFPGCHLTWAIGTCCRGVITNNPYIDSVWEVPLANPLEVLPVWEAFEMEALRRCEAGEFDHCFFPQIWPRGLANYDGTIRPSMFRNYPRPITVPVETIIELTPEEAGRVQQWVIAKGLHRFDQVVVFECTSKSGQSFMTKAMAVAIAERVTRQNPDVAFVISTHEPVQSDSARIISGRDLSMRETAALTHYATLFVGCGSGLTVVATSAAAKWKLPNIQILERSTSAFASFRHDFEYFGKPTDHFLEITSPNINRIARAIDRALVRGIAEARDRFGETLPLEFHWYLSTIDLMLVQRNRLVDAARSLTITAGRYGWQPQLRNFARHCVAPFLDLDPASTSPERQEDVERFRDAERFYGSWWRRQARSRAA